MAQHEASGKHSAKNTSSDKSSQETKKMESSETTADEEKASTEETKSTDSENFSDDTTKKIDSEKVAKASAPTEKLDAVDADETKEMPKASSSKTKGKHGIDPKDKKVEFHAADDEAEELDEEEELEEEYDPEAAAAAEEKKRKAIRAAIIAIAVIIIAIIVFMFVNSNQGVKESDDLDMVDVEATPVDNPINFAEWQAHNPDVYAYMTIPNTNIDLPILFNADEDNYYLVHDIDHNYTIVGAIYSQSMNSRDFRDPVTVLYGHTLLNGTMFTQLHSFESEAFFEANPYFNVYLPDEILTYEVISAFEYDNRHIMNTFDFSDPNQVAEFYATVQAPESQNARVRDLDRPLVVGEDSILVLSTCTVPSNEDARYLVVGRLISTQPAVPMEEAAVAAEAEAEAEAA